MIYIIIILSILGLWHIVNLIKQKDYMVISKRGKLEIIDNFVKLLCNANVGAKIIIIEYSSLDKIYLTKLQNEKKWWIQLAVDQKIQNELDSFFETNNYLKDFPEIVMDENNGSLVYNLGYDAEKIISSLKDIIPSIFEFDKREKIFIKTVRLKADEELVFFEMKL